MVDEQIQCKSCKRVFVPSQSSRRRIQGQSTAKPFIIGGAVLAIAIAFGVIISSGGGGEKEREVKPPPKLVATGIENPRVRDVVEWVDAVRTGNDFKLNQLSDYSALKTYFGLGAEVSPSQAPEAVRKLLIEDPRTAFLRAGEVTMSSVPKEMAESETGYVAISIGLLDPAQKAKFEQPTAEYRVEFRSADGRYRVVGWEVMYEPKPRNTAPKGPRASTHKELGAAKDVERTINGQTFTAREVELAPLGHLEGTPPEQQAEIDRLIAVLATPDADPREINRSILRLRDLGKPSVPRLLNQLYEFTQAGIEANRLTARVVTRALEDLTGQRFGFDPSSAVAGNLAKEEYRLSALKQWYGWWADNHWRKDFDYAIEKEESLESSGKGTPAKKN